MDSLVRFIKEEEGVTAIEYALIGAVIALGILVSIRGVRDWIIAQFDANTFINFAQWPWRNFIL